MGRLWPTAAISLCILLTAACGGGETNAKTTTTTPTPTGSTAKTTTAAPATSTAPVDAAALPLCGEAKAEGGNAVDCRLVSHDHAGLSFVVRYSRGQATVAVTAPDGRVLQTIVESGSGDIHGVNTFFEPQLLDLADDGRDQLVIPLLTGVANSTFAVYRATDAEPEFVRSGEVFGIAVDRTETGGYIVGEAREGAGQYWHRQYWKFSGKQLRLVGATKTAYNANGPQHCGVEDGLRTDHPELMDDALAQRFCVMKSVKAEPIG